jgi:hypothetical protein
MAPGAIAFQVLALGQAVGEGPSGCQPMPERQTLETSPPINIGLLADQLV